jgi:Na+/melibiose symporter-like transporter
MTLFDPFAQFVRWWPDIQAVVLYVSMAGGLVGVLLAATTLARVNSGRSTTGVRQVRQAVALMATAIVLAVLFGLLPATVTLIPQLPAEVAAGINLTITVVTLLLLAAVLVVFARSRRRAARARQ